MLTTEAFFPLYVRPTAGDAISPCGKTVPCERRDFCANARLPGAADRDRWDFAESVPIIRAKQWPRCPVPACSMPAFR